MQVTTERPEQAALTIDKSASVLGLHEFSLLSRIVRDCLLETRLLHTSPHIFAFLATCLLVPSLSSNDLFGWLQR